MTETTIDYTAMRLNTRAGRGVIRRCPKCKRKGAYRVMRTPKAALWMCTHTAVDLGLVVAHRDHCSGSLEEAKP